MKSHPGITALTYAAAAREVLRAAGDGGWEVRRIQFSARSWYFKFSHAALGNICVRISDHRSRGYRVRLNALAVLLQRGERDLRHVCRVLSRVGPCPAA